ncbi:MAG: tetratricopeptide repeat protein [Verrucomicrobia bacterium]|nr:tetratricopeptide repeat protein [Verrucomicrobiota bacterium]MDA1087665.1 tetratricopeptide repeat protein [Verrucomicrobiota bacterium]
MITPLAQARDVAMRIAIAMLVTLPGSAVFAQEPSVPVVEPPHELERASVELDEDTRGWIARAKAHARVLEWDVAESLFRRAHEKYPEDGYLQFALGTALIETRKHREAVELLVPLVERFPNHPSLLNNLAWLFGKTEDEDIKDLMRASGYAQAALVASPDSPLIWSTATEIYYRRGEFKQALSMAGIALELARGLRIENISDFVDLQERCARAVRAMEILE